MSGAVATMRPVGAHHPDPDHGPRRIVLAMIGVIVAFIVTAVAWGSYAQLDVAAQGRGAVLPSGRLQEVQSLEGGIVQELLVGVGERVKAGQTLARLDTAQADADLGESRQAQWAAMASRARVEALLKGGTPQFDKLLREAAPELVDKEMQLWRDAQREYQSNQLGAREAVQRRRSELAEAESRIQSLQGSLRLAEEAFAIEERLFNEGAGARSDYLAAQQRLMTQRADIDSIRQSLPRLRAGLAEAQAQGSESDAKARSIWGTQRSELQTKNATLSATIGGRQDKAARRELVSPVAGVVNRVLINTRGGVAGPGKAILEVVPDDPNLLMSVRIKPSDIGFIRAGQDAHVRILPYDASTYGQLNAQVKTVGADAVVDEKGESYFEVQLVAARDQLKLHGKPLPITPGMPVDVGILTGQRSVMQYLLKPVLRSFQGALQER